MIKTVASRYNELSLERQPFLDRARDAAKYTIPSLIPPEGADTSTTYTIPHQSVGARGVNTLASRILLALLPPNMTFFRLGLDDAIKAQIQDEEVAVFDETLSKIEQSILGGIEETQLRNTAFTLFQHAIVAGSVLLYIGEKNSRIYPLSQFVCKRDGEGNVLEVVIVEMLDVVTLPAEVVAQIKPKLKENDKKVKVYTHIKRVDGDGRAEDHWEIKQEVLDVSIKGTEAEYPLNACPYQAIRWVKVPGESYGRSHVEHYQGDLISLDALTKALVDGAELASWILYFVKPGGMTSKEQVSKAKTGDVLDGEATDVTTLQQQKASDLAVAKQLADTIRDDLAGAFLMRSSIQRNAERVTAEEIRFMAQELETALGGVYSTLATEFQLPIVQIMMTSLARQKRLPVLPKNTIKPIITTGFEALGRSQELSRMDAAIGGTVQLFGPQVLSELNVGEILRRRFTQMGVSPEGLIKSPEQKAQEQQQAMMSQMAEKLGPAAIQTGGKMMMQNKEMAAQQPPPTE